MNLNQDDFLQEIPNDDLPKLACMYEQVSARFPHTCNLLKMGMLWKSSIEGEEHIKFFSPNNSWREDGTFVAILKLDRYSTIMAYTLDDTSKSLIEAFSKTNRITCDYVTQIFAMCQVHTDATTAILHNRGFETYDWCRCLMFCLAKEKALQLEIECPPDVYIQKLDASAAKSINEHWPHKFQNSEYMIATLIELNGGYGIFLKQNRELVTWVVLDRMFLIGMLHTVSCHRGKGYAVLITKVLAKKLAEQDRHTILAVVKENNVAISLFRKLDFHLVGPINFFKLK